MNVSYRHLHGDVMQRLHTITQEQYQNHKGGPLSICVQACY